jgi:hypothetical protein
MAVTIKRAKQGVTYKANELPASISEERVEWTRLGLDEEFNVILHREGRRIEVVECVWDEDKQDWDDRTVAPETVNLVVVVP